MQNIPIKSVPNQSLTIRVNNDIYNIEIKSINDLMSISFVRNNIVIIENIRAIPMIPLIPYKYLYDGYGNFAFLTMDDEYPDYNLFNISQSLVFLTDEEIESVGI